MVRVKVNEAERFSQRPRFVPSGNSSLLGNRRDISRREVELWNVEASEERRDDKVRATNQDPRNANVSPFEGLNFRRMLLTAATEGTSSLAPG